VLQTSLPEVLCQTGLGSDVCNRFESVAGASALVIGPGCGVSDDMVRVVDTWLNAGKMPTLVDADALNVIAQQGWQKRIPSGSVITPHVGEFDRLFGPHRNHFDRLETQLKKSKELRIFIVLKGAHTRITTPKGMVYFNATGNPGMATAGSGDVLSGIIGSLLAQGYEADDACVLGVYVHGLAGDVAAEARGMDSLIARDIIEFIGDAYTHLRGFDNHAG
jgi:NAD(P)H-hydrate epimerase